MADPQTTPVPRMSHPPFVPSHKFSGQDTYSHAGAQRLAAMIRMAWAKVGHDVPVEVAPINSWPDTPYTVRMPTLINGRPCS